MTRVNANRVRGPNFIATIDTLCKINYCIKCIYREALEQYPRAYLPTYIIIHTINTPCNMRNRGKFTQFGLETCVKTGRGREQTQYIIIIHGINWNSCKFKSCKIPFANRFNVAGPISSSLRTDFRSVTFYVRTFHIYSQLVHTAKFKRISTFKNSLSSSHPTGL